MDSLTESLLQRLWLKEKQFYFKIGKQAWEKVVESHDGLDPLKIWSQYMFWYHRNHIFDTEGEYSEILRKCLLMFESKPEFFNDSRLVRMWLNYISLQENPLEYFNLLFLLGIGRKNARFYAKWVRYCESEDKHKQAEAIFEVAFEQQAQPFLLRIAYKKYIKRRPEEPIDFQNWLVESRDQRQQDLQDQDQLQCQDQDPKDQDQAELNQKTEDLQEEDFLHPCEHPQEYFSESNLLKEVRKFEHS